MKHWEAITFLKATQPLSIRTQIWSHLKWLSVCPKHSDAKLFTIILLLPIQRLGARGCDGKSSVSCQLDWMWNQLRDLPTGGSVRRRPSSRVSGTMSPSCGDPVIKQCWESCGDFACLLSLVSLSLHWPRSPLLQNSIT